MKIRRPRIARIPWLSWRRRVRTPSPSPSAEHAGELGGTLRVFRAAALWGIAALILTAAGSAFAESYRGLWLWAQHHGLAGFWAAAFPLQVDLFVAVGELVLFVAMADRWTRRDRAGAWAVALLGLAASVAGNVGHVAAHDLQSRGTAAVPPIAAFAALWLGLGVLKRIVRRHGSGPHVMPVADIGPAEQGADSGPLGETIAELAAAVRVLAERASDTIPSPDTATAQSGLIADLLDAVRGLGAQISGAFSSPVPVGVEHAALIAYRATVAAGNPYSMNALQVRFGLTRSQAEKVRAAIADEHGRAPADVNGHHFEPVNGAASSSN